MIEVLFLDPALAEMLEAARWYNQKEAGVGHEFLRAVDLAIDRLAFDPSARPTAGRGVYRQFVDRFPFDLLYRIGPERIEVLAVVHHSRKPGYWQHRAR
jgi:toxin ParE1/3/4